MSRKLLGACAAFLLAIVPVAVTGQGGDAAPAGEAAVTQDRISLDQLAELVSVPMSLVEKEGLPAAQAAFERLLAAARAGHGERSIEVADLFTAFGVGLYGFGQDSDDRRIKEEALRYLEAAIAAYRTAPGDTRLDLATALNSYADAQMGLDEDDPPESAETALDEAYRIRLAALGPDNVVTLASLRYLARARGHPSRTRGDRARIEAAAGLFRQLIAHSSNDARPEYVSTPYAYSAFARMYAQNRMPDEAREQLRLAIRQARSWTREERCIFATSETAAVENILAGETGGTQEVILPSLNALDCFAPEEEDLAPARTARLARPAGFA
jgi:tetratricopeptide (TPR) repeat protein